jgi:LysM repeat protein
MLGVFYFLCAISFFIFFPNNVFSQQTHLVNSLLHIPLPSEIEFCGEPLPLQHEDIKERLDLEMVVILGSPITTTLWFKRMPRYFPLIERVIKELGLPGDLKYVALIESNLRQDAVSPAGAVGPWQFMRCTGETCGLQKSRYQDERRNWEKATKAALKHLADLKNELGSWYLALAAYNSGLRRVKKAMRTQKENSFFNLSLPLETERYILRAIAAKLIVENPVRYGLRLDGARLLRPEQISTTYVELKRRRLPVWALAEAADVSYRKFGELNPEVLANVLPRGVYKINIPSEAKASFHEKLNKWKAGNPEKKTVKTKGSKKFLIYKVRPGDTLSKIAGKFKVSIKTICARNRIKSPDDIRVGQRLIIRK